MMSTGELERKYVLRSWAVQGRSCSGKRPGMSLAQELRLKSAIA